MSRRLPRRTRLASMKVPPKRKGNSRNPDQAQESEKASMKVPPKRKGNTDQFGLNPSLKCLNESPSEKEGKCANIFSGTTLTPRLNESPSEKEGKSKTLRAAASLHSLMPQ